MAELLIVDDVRSVREGLAAVFADAGFSVRTARDGDDALAKFAARRPDLVLLDAMMPNRDGFETCREIRAADRLVPIIFLTALDSEANQVRGLGLGADDYVSKAAAHEVLVARVNRALARAAEAGSDAPPPAELRLGPVTVDLDRGVLSSGGGATYLTKTETDILRILAGRDGRPIPVDELIGALRGAGFACEDSMIYVHMSRLRRKLGPAADCLSNERGAGYRLAPPSGDGIRAGCN